MTARRYLATYDAHRARYAFLHASYLGGEAYRYPAPSTLATAVVRWTSVTQSGDQVTEERRFNSYLVPHPAEDDKSFEMRVALSSTVNLCEIIVDSYAEGATRGVQRQLGSLAEYESNVDMRGTSWNDFVQDGARWLAGYGFGYGVIDAPKADGDVVTRADEIAKGVRPYSVFVHPSAVAWLYTNEFGTVTEFAYVDQPYQESTTAAGAMQDVTIRVYHSGRVDDAGNEIPAGWEVLAGTVTATQALVGQRTALKVVESGLIPKGIAEATGLPIPVVPGFGRQDTSSRAPKGISFVENAADIARTIYNRRSYELQIQREAGFPTLAVPAKATQGKLPPGSKLIIGSAKAIGYDADSGAPQWIQPSAEWARDMRESNLADFQAGLRTAGLEMATEAGASSSGEALRIRSRDFEARCARFAKALQSWETTMLKLFAFYAGVPFDAEITYPRRFVLPDLSADLERALALLNPSRMPVEIGSIAKAEATMQAILAALVVTDDKAAKIREQIDQILAEDEAEIAAQRKVSAAQRDKMMANFAAPKPANDAQPVSDEDDDADPPRQAA
jgi:hypothetical protein